MRRPPHSLLSKLLPVLALPILLTACGGSKDKGDPPPAPTAACKVLRVAPEASVTAGFIDPLMTVVYSSEKAGACDDIALVDKAMTKVPTAVVTANEWTNPDGGIVGTRTLEPVQPLRPGTPYALHLNGKTVTFFTTGTERRGSLVAVSDQALKLSPIPESAHVSRAAIDGVLDAFAERLAKHRPFEAALLKAMLRRELPHLARPDAKHGAHLSRITYRSADSRGNPVTLSGLVIAPEQNLGGTPVDYNGMPVVVGQRGAIRDQADAPSLGANAIAVPGLIAAAKGHLFLAPDLIGLGESAALPQAYLVAADTAAQTQDMLRAVREHFLQKHLAKPGPDLRIIGASQGGYSAIAALPHLAREGTIRMISVAEGPYDIYRTFNGPLLTAGGAAPDAYALHEDMSFLPSHVRDVMSSYKAYGNLPFDPAQVFSPDGQFLPAFLLSYKNRNQPDLVAQLGANTLAGTTQVYDLPQAQVKLYHFSTDSLVPAQNTTDLLASLSGAKHRFAGLQRGDCRESSELVKLVVKLSKSSLRTHTICVPFQIDDFVAEL